MRAGNEQVGAIGKRRVPEIDAYEEVEVLERLPVVQGVAHVHEVTGLSDAGHDRVGVARLHLLVAGVGVGPVLPPLQNRELINAGELVQRCLVRIGRTAHVGVASEVHLNRRQEARGAATVATGGVPVARDAHQRVERAGILDSVATVLDGEHVADAAVAVTGLRTQARGVGHRRFLNLLGGNMRDDRRLVGSVLGAAGLEVLPNRLDLMDAAIGKSHLIASRQGRVDGHGEPVLLGKARLIGHPSLGHTGEQVVLLGLLAAHHALLHGPRFALPQHRLSVEVGEAVCQGVPAH